MILNFNDRRGEIFYSYSYEKEIIKKVITFDKKSLVKMTLEYSSFIQKRTQKFIYDFDILNIEKN